MSGFDLFVVFAEMRTGSNFLETNLNALDGVQCHGEAFNPHFIGYPNRAEILGLDQAARDADPLALLARMRTAPGLNGFRFFNDHDPRVLEAVLPDPRVAKIILTRNPVDSYVSWKIAQATGQWKLTNVKQRKAEQVRFDAAEFEAHLAALQEFQVRLLNGLQKTGQTAFYLAYEDLGDLEVMNGLARWLGVEARLETIDQTLKKQNPDGMEAKVANFDGMEQALARLDRFDLNRTPNFEPRRSAAVPSFAAAPESPLLFMPVKSGPEAAIRRWLAGLDGADTGGLIAGFTQKTLRQWMRARPGHRSFTVLRHPVARAHAAFCERILPPHVFPEIRATLRKVFRLDIPPEPDGTNYDDDRHRAAFLGWLKFLKANLNAQTAIRVDGAWASQAATLQGFANFALPDAILREDEGLEDQLAFLAHQVGHAEMPVIDAPTDPHRERLLRIYDDELEAAARDAYARDYVVFGFGDLA